MAKFTPGPAVAEVRGSVGGTTFTRTRYGAIMRVRTKPVVSGTSWAQNAKGRFTTGTQSWQGLTAAQKMSWNEWCQTNPVTGSLGEKQVLTGHVAYVGSHVRAAILGETPLTTPPIDPSPVGLASLVLSGDIGIGTFGLAFTATPLGATELLWIRAAVCDSSGIVYVKNLLKHCGQSAAAQASPFDCQVLVEARIGTLVAGQTLHVDVCVVDDVTMQKSGSLVDSVVITETS